MNTRICAQEDELLDALQRGFVRPELEEHTVSCPSCSELRSVAGALLEERRTAILEAPVPSAGTMWYRLQVRLRQETQTRAQRALLAGQATTVLIATLFVGALFGSQAMSGLRHFVAGLSIGMPLLVVLGVCLVTAPVAGWVASRQR